MGEAPRSLGYVQMEDYLVLENASRYKHEYLEGVIYAIQGEPARGMAGGSQVHSRLIRNATVALHQLLAGTPCEVLATEMRLRVDAAEAMFYPDVLVHCGHAGDPSSTQELTHARVVLEVLSPTTQHFDRGAKLTAYRKLSGLQQIVLLSSLEQAAWSLQRDDTDGPWQPMTPWPRASTLQVPSLGLELPWGKIYDGVGLP